MLKLKAIGMILALVLAVVAVGCGVNKGTQEEEQAARLKITVSGSTALLPLVSQAKTNYEKVNPGITVNVTGGGSFTGLQQVAEGVVDIGNSDVLLTPEYENRGLIDHLVAVAPFVIITHPDVKVDSLSSEQLIDIFTGKITDWKEISGDERRISIIHRPTSSGSRATIKEIVLKEQEFTSRAVSLNSNGEVRKSIATTPGSIGYVDAAYVDNTVKAIKYNGVAYVPENVFTGEYPIFAYEHMYTKGEPKGVVKEFLGYIMSTAFQEQYLERLGFLPVSKMSRGRIMG